MGLRVLSTSLCSRMLNISFWESLRSGSASSDFYQEIMSGKWKGVVSASPLRSPPGLPGAPEFLFLPITVSSPFQNLGSRLFPPLPAVLGHSAPEQSFEYTVELPDWRQLMNPEIPRRTPAPFLSLHLSILLE